jgi:anti-sigma factor RsiW
LECEKARNLFSPYLDGELDPSEGGFLVAHLQNCAECRRELSELTASLKLLRSLPEIAPAGGFALAVRKRLAQSGGERAQGAFAGSAASGGGRSGQKTLARLFWAAVRRRTWLAAAVALVLAFGLAVYLSGGAGRGGGPKPPEQLASAPLSASPAPNGEKAGAAKNELAQKVFSSEKETAADAPGGKATRAEEGDRPPSGEGENSLEKTRSLPGSSATATAKPAPAAGGTPAAPAGPDARTETEEPKLFSASRESQPARPLSVSSPKVARTVKISLQRLDSQELESFLEKFAPGLEAAKEPPLAFRIPPSRLPELLAAAKSWGAVTGVQDDSRDLTEEYLRLEAALLEKQGNIKTQGDKQEVEELRQKIQDVEQRAAQVTVEIFWPE